MTSLEEARGRFERALARLERTIQSRLAGVAGSDAGAEVEELRRRCAALEQELERLSRENDRLRKALGEAVERIEGAADMLEQGVEG